MEQVIPLKFASVGLSIHILAFYYPGDGTLYTIYHIQNCVQVHYTRSTCKLQDNRMATPAQ